MENDEPENRHPSTMKRLLGTLNDYKEVLSIIVFFLGGVWWIQDRFPTKTDLNSNVNFIKCQLKEYMELTQQQIKHEQASASLAEVVQELGSPMALQRAVELSPSMQQMIAGFKDKETYFRSEVDASSTAMSNINDNLARGICSGESE